jgi:hypothetical protein
MPISVRVINSKFSRPGDFKRPPLVGFSVDWWGHVAGFTLDRQGLHLGVDDAEPSRLQRWKLLPRFSYEFDYAGKRLLLKNTPLLEALANTTLREFSLQRLWTVVDEQLVETRPPSTTLRNMR